MVVLLVEEVVELVDEEVEVDDVEVVVEVELEVVEEDDVVVEVELVLVLVLVLLVVVLDVVVLVVLLVVVVWVVVEALSDSFTSSLSSETFSSIPSELSGPAVVVGARKLVVLDRTVVGLFVTVTFKLMFGAVSLVSFSTSSSSCSSGCGPLVVLMLLSFSLGGSVDVVAVVGADVVLRGIACGSSMSRSSNHWVRLSISGWNSRSPLSYPM
mmetsp:Transcript_75126/g.179376  ORF Transcript_75126/g.179376 Transcript_75126/m.179376 type:complete len:212 (+) Transcript_75126:118-753(+)